MNLVYWYCNAKSILNSSTPFTLVQRILCHFRRQVIHKRKIKLPKLSRRWWTSTNVVASFACLKFRLKSDLFHSKFIRFRITFSTRNFACMCVQRYICIISVESAYTCMYMHIYTCTCMPIIINTCNQLARYVQLGLGLYTR